MTQNTLAQARQNLEELKADLVRDPGLLVFTFRDLPETAEVGLNDLAWVLSSDNGHCHRNDAIGFFELFIKFTELK